MLNVIKKYTNILCDVYYIFRYMHQIYVFIKLLTSLKIYPLNFILYLIYFLYFYINKFIYC